MSYDLICAALEPLGIPVTAHEGDATEPIYAVITELTETPAVSADDLELTYDVHSQISFIARTDIRNLVDRAERLLTRAGFRRRGRHTDYEPESRTYYFALRVVISLVYDNDDEEEPEHG